MEQKTQSANTNGSPKARQAQPIMKGDSDDFLEDALQVLPGMLEFEKKMAATDDGEESSPNSSNKKRTAVTPNSKSSKALDSSKAKDHTRTSTKSSTATKQELDENAATAHGAQKEKDAATKQELCNTTTKSNATKQERGHDSAATTQGRRSSDNGSTTKSGTKKSETKHQGASSDPATVTIQRGGTSIEVPTQPLVNKPTPQSKKEAQKLAQALNEVVSKKIEPFCAKSSPKTKINLTAAELQAYVAKQQTEALIAAQKKEKAKVTQIETKFQQELVAKEMDRAEAEKRLKALQRKSEEDQLRMANLEKIARDALAQKTPANGRNLCTLKAHLSAPAKKKSTQHRPSPQRVPETRKSSKGKRKQLSTKTTTVRI